MPGSSSNAFVKTLAQISDLICMEGSDSLQIYTVTVFLFCRKIILSAELNDRQFTLQGCFLKNGQPCSRSQRDLILDIILYFQYCLMCID